MITGNPGTQVVRFVGLLYGELQHHDGAEALAEVRPPLGGELTRDRKRHCGTSRPESTHRDVS
jgi:hypothetical protein